MKKGYTIVELLVVISLSLILGAGFYTFYQSVVKENISKGSLAKREQDVYIMLEQVIKDFQSVGFGVDIDNLKMTNGSGCDLSTDNPVLTKCSNGNNDTISFLSLSASDEVYSGCWGFIDTNGNIKYYNSYDILGRPCQNINGKHLVLSTSKKKLTDSYDPTTLNPNYKNAYAFYVGNKTYPDDFKVKYFLDNTNLPKECAPGTYNLQKTTSTTSPVISCVLNFKVRYIDTNNNLTDNFNIDTDPLQNLKKLQGLKLCMIVQVGGRQSTPENPPNYSSNGGCPIFNYNDSNWRYYRWVVIEQTIPLKNIH